MLVESVAALPVGFPAVLFPEREVLEGEVVRGFSLIELLRLLRKMPLGQRPGDRSDSRYCGVETDFDDDMAQVLASNTSGGFDFVVSHLIDPSNRPSLSSRDGNGASVPPFAASDLILSPAQ